VSFALWKADRSEPLLLQDAYRSRDTVLLRLLEEYVPNRYVPLTHVRDLYRLLSEAGVADAEKWVTAERVSYYSEVWNAVIDWKQQGLLSSGDGVMAFLMMLDATDRQLGEMIVRDRWTGSTKQAQELLVEMKRSSLPLVDGSL
jgi:hypothetical protein